MISKYLTLLPYQKIPDENVNVPYFTAHSIIVWRLAYGDHFIYQILKSSNTTVIKNAQ